MRGSCQGDMPIYLGIDAGTQSLTVLALDVEGARCRVCFEHTVSYDRDLPAFGTRHGVLPADDPRVAAAPPVMWAAALDRAIGTAAAAGLDPARVAAVSGSAQQHGSVYLDALARSRLAALDASHPLVDQLSGIFTRPVAPIWLDTSTERECEEITRALGGASAVARLTGSRVFERFTAPQIRRFFKTDPAAYARTHRVHLVSSYLASLLLGADAPLEPGDASGMNLMELATRQWSREALEATAPGLRERLPDIVPSSTVVGPIAPYWRRRHGLTRARVVVWSGDNPSSLVGTGLVAEGRLGVSLGTSDTAFGPMALPREDPTGTGHVFGAPTGEFMGLTVFSNGSLAREAIRDAYRLDWLAFSRALDATPAGNGGAMLLPWFVPEITPHVAAPGVRREGLDPADAAGNVRAVVEAQMMALANHTRWMGVTPHTIHATGGAAANRAILQVMADVFNARVCQLPVGNSACLGAALRAWEADARASGLALPWEVIVRGVTAPAEAADIVPVPAHAAIYGELRARYAQLEARYRTPSSSSTTS